MGGVFGYSHLAGGYQGGQADFVRVPYGEPAAAAAAAADKRQEKPEVA
jgi:threonine dehydrogenase-like Zn-dependent dehydrogenase